MWSLASKMDLCLAGLEYTKVILEVGSLPLSYLLKEVATG